MKPQEKLIEIAEKEIGYLEKKSDKQLDDKTANAGSANYTKYARDLYPALQGQPWCDMFVDWCFVRAFGEIKAKQLIGGGFSAYTPTSAQYYKNKGKWHETPKPGDQVFFKNSTRIFHTGIVVNADTKELITIEGNTGSAPGVIPNGGGVFKKVYPIRHSSISGYGRPDWSLVDEPRYEIGWNRDDKGWWWSPDGNTYLKDCWKDINGHRYYFKSSGYAATGWREINGKWYYFEPRTGHPIECALYITDSDGAQDIGRF